MVPLYNWIDRHGGFSGKRSAYHCHPQATKLSAMSDERPHNTHARDSERFRQNQGVRCGVLTVSDSRTGSTDRGGPLIRTSLEEAGYIVVDHALVPDDPAAISARLSAWCGEPMLHAIIATGGTGLSRRDVTVEVVRSLISLEIPGFGELFRMLSYEQVKSASMLSRAIAGLALRPPDEGGETYIFALPGSPNAIEVAMNDLIVPQLAHLVWERSK